MQKKAITHILGNRGQKCGVGPELGTVAKNRSDAKKILQNFAGLEIPIAVWLEGAAINLQRLRIIGNYAAELELDGKSVVASESPAGVVRAAIGRYALPARRARDTYYS